MGSFGAEIWVFVLGWVIGAGSPGPATLAISGTSMGAGRASGLMMAAGIVCGSAFWGITAALGMSALMMTHAWIIEVVRYAGAAYLLYLAVKSFRNAMRPGVAKAVETSRGRLFAKGVLLHLTNPKPVFGWGAIYALALPTGAASAQVWQLFALLMGASMGVFFGYAVLFSSPRIARGYRAARRWFEFGFAGIFGAASVKVLTSKIEM